MKRHYLIMALWWGTIFAADQTPQEEMSSKVPPINIPSTLVMKEDQGAVSIVLAADIQGNAATATYALKAQYADYAEKAASAEQATYAVQTDTAKHALQADRANVADQAHQSEQTAYAEKANYALKAERALQSDKALSADKATQAEYALRSSHADYAACAAHADKALQAERTLYAAQSDKATQADQAACAACASIFTDPLAGDVTGNQTSTVVTTVGGQSASTIASAIQTIQAATADATLATIVMRDGQGDFAAHIITADLQGNAATATSALKADYAATTANAVQAEHASSSDQATQAVHAEHADYAQKAANAEQATYAVQTDTAKHALKATHALQTDYALQSDKALSADKATQAEYAVRCSQADYATCAIHADKTLQAERALYATQSDKAAQADQATCAACAHIFTEPLAGDVIGNQTSTVVTTVGGQSASTIASAIQTIQAATADATSNTIVMRDGQGDFSAHIITADLQGNAATATSALKAQQADYATCAIHADKALVADQATHAAHALQADKAGIADQAHKSEQAACAEKANYALQADHATVADKAKESQKAKHTLFADQAIKATHALQADCATCADKAVQANIFTELLAGDVIGNQTTTVVATVGGQTAEAIAIATQHVHAATSKPQAYTHVVRDAQGSLEATKIYADVEGNIKLKDVAQAGLISTNDQGNLSPLHTKPHTLCVGNDTHTLSSIGTGATGHVLVGSTDNDPYFAPLGTNAGLTEHGVIIGQGDKEFVAIAPGLDGQVLIGATGNDPVFASLTSHGNTIKITRGPHSINLETSSENLKEFPTDTGIALPSGGRLSIRGSQNMRVRAIGSSIIIAMNNSPAVSGSLTAGTTVTAGTGLTVVSGGATITGDTNINNAGTGATTIGNAKTITTLHGAVGIPDSLEVYGKASFDQGFESRGSTVIAAAEETPSLIIKNGNQQTTPLRLMGTPHAAGAPLLIDAQGNISTAPASIAFAQNMRPLTTESEKLYALEPVIFDYTSNYGASKNQYGLIAEDVEKYLPEIVVHKQDGTPYAISYYLLIPLLIKELQKQRKILHDLTACDDCDDKGLSAVKK